MSEFKVGDRVWVAEYGHGSVTMLCGGGRWRSYEVDLDAPSRRSLFGSNELRPAHPASNAKAKRGSVAALVNRGFVTDEVGRTVPKRDARLKRASARKERERIRKKLLALVTLSSTARADEFGSGWNAAMDVFEKWLSKGGVV